MIDPSLPNQIENVVRDLLTTDQGSFERHIKKLARLLHAPGLDEYTRQFAEGVDIAAWLEEGRSRGGSMVGSGRLEWPADPKRELGTTIRLIEMFAEEPRSAIDFAFTFCYAGSSFIADNLRNVSEQVLVPFARDYLKYVAEADTAGRITAAPQRSTPGGARRVFIVHGHDDAPREAVARFLERIGFEAVILHEQANKGRTVIEKFEAEGNVGFVVVLLTPDDTGAKLGEEQQPRTRQNVLLEWGYFIGSLGRSRVCALKKGDVELPSDIVGVVCEPFDEHGSWQKKLGQELQAAGFDVDWNEVMRA